MKAISMLIFLLFSLFLQNCGKEGEMIQKEDVCKSIDCNNLTTDSLKLEPFEAIIAIDLNGNHVMINESGLSLYGCNIETLDTIATTKIVIAEGRLKKKCDSSILKIRLIKLETKELCPILPDTVNSNFTIIRKWDFIGISKIDSLQYPPCESVRMFMDLLVNEDEDSSVFEYKMKLQNAENFELGKFNLINDSLLIFDNNYGATLSIGTPSEMMYEANINSFYFNSDTIKFKIDKNFITLQNHITNEKIYFYTTL